MMMKYLAGAAFIGILAASPATAAAKLKCTTASMAKVDGMIKDAMANPKMKKQEEMAMKEAEMAMKAKESGDKKGCAMHLNMAEKSLMSHN